MLFLFLVVLFLKHPLSLETSGSEGLKHHSCLNIPVLSNVSSKGNTEWHATSGFILKEKNQHNSEN